MFALAEVVAAAGDHVRPLRRVEYDRLVADGVFEGERIELLRGVLVTMSPQDPLHSDAVDWLHERLSSALPPGWRCRCQLPFALSGDGEPEPDLAVVPDRRYRTAHPDAAALLIEVTRTSHATDLGTKAADYAAGGIGEYWVVDLRDRAVVRFRQPGPDGYVLREAHRGGVLAPAALPGVTVDLDELFG